MSLVFLRPLSSSLLFFLLVNLYYLVKSASNSLINDKCMTCKFLSKTFLEGLEKTEKLHFGGGNTDWEERNLGRFKTSETRFVEILDYVCKKDSSAEIGFSGIKDLQFKCHSLLEAHEELLGQWFFEHQDNGPTLGKYLCIENLKLCCDEGYFGADCSPCSGMKLSGKPCFGNGQCQGNGTRNGNGTCSCHAGYVGKMCSNCDSSYFAVSQNSSYIECEECFDGCSSGCVGPSPKDCRSCRIGYKMDPEIGCNDIDECAERGKCDKSNEKCVNTPGSFECQCVDGFKRLDSGECSVDVEGKTDEIGSTEKDDGAEAKSSEETEANEKLKINKENGEHDEL
ncbi:hypothetical protein niasHT_011370 [Heterodera trifolii]|uniref:EGF-like domain-containing protein n=1 Tax=Heterodera trifolii TaxID=157864 RepID=A0ABD2LIF6_9BILA